VSAPSSDDIANFLAVWRRLLEARIAAYNLRIILETAMNRLTPIALALLLATLERPAAASDRWTFCVASALGAKDVWITEVFLATLDGERLEANLKSILVRQGSPRIVAQCPQPNDDKTSVVNAQVAAEDYNHKLGATLHAVSAQEFPPRR
jgi:hypothetical protein